MNDFPLFSSLEIFFSGKRGQGVGGRKQARLLKIKSCNCVVWIDFWWAVYPLRGNVFLHNPWPRDFLGEISEICFPWVWTQAWLSPASTLPWLLRSLRWPGHFLCAHLFFSSGQFFFAGQRYSTNSSSHCTFCLMGDKNCQWDNGFFNCSASTPKRLWPVSSSHLKSPFRTVLWSMWGRSTKSSLWFVLFLARGPLVVISMQKWGYFPWHSGSLSTPPRRPFHYNKPHT